MFNFLTNEYKLLNKLVDSNHRTNQLNVIQNERNAVFIDDNGAMNLTFFSKHHTYLMICKMPNYGASNEL